MNHSGDDMSFVFPPAPPVALPVRHLKVIRRRSGANGCATHPGVGECRDLHWADALTDQRHFIAMLSHEVRSLLAVITQVVVKVAAYNAFACIIVFHFSYGVSNILEIGTILLINNYLSTTATITTCYSLWIAIIINQHISIHISGINYTTAITIWTCGIISLRLSIFIIVVIIIVRRIMPRTAWTTVSCWAIGIVCIFLLHVPLAQLSSSTLLAALLAVFFDELQCFCRCFLASRTFTRGEEC